MQRKKKSNNREALPRLYLEYELIDGNGRLLRKGRRRRANSFVGNIVALLFCITSYSTTTYVSQAGYPSAIRDRTGALRDIHMASAITAAASYGTHTYGIRVGTGTTAVAIDQYNLASPITHGTAAGQLLYADTLVEPITRGSTEWLFRIIRSFSNSTDSTITVNEVGLFLNISGGYFAMLARDLTGGIPVPSGATITFRYIISHSV